MSKYNKIWVLLLLPLQLLVSKPVIAEPIEIVPITFESEINRIFGDKTEIALAVFKHESASGTDLKNWNCIYNGISTFCKKQDRARAWSVDCGIAQINIRGKICPPELMTELGSIPYIEKIYKEQGLKAWVSFKSGAYQKFL